MVHISSGIECLIAFDHDETMAQSKDVISNFTVDPLCKCKLLLLDFVFRICSLDFECVIDLFCFFP